MPQTSPKILIADDEPLLTELLEFRLSARGYQTIVARDGREALAMLAADKPQAVLLDMMMQTINGRFTSAEALGHREFVMTRLFESA